MVPHSLYAGGLRAILTDQNKLVVAVGGVTALAAGVYTTRYYRFGKFLESKRLTMHFLTHEHL